MTKQDNFLGQIGPIKIGGGFRHRITGPTPIYPSERLTAFLNTDTSNEKQIIDFCNKYAYLPQKIGSDLRRVFKQEQKHLRQIATRLLSGNKLTEKEIAKVNQRLFKIKTEIKYVEGSQLANINKSLGGSTENLDEENQEEFTLVLKRHCGTNVSLWQNLIEQFISNRLKNCLWCGKFFLRQSRHVRKFCSDECRNKHSKP